VPSVKQRLHALCLAYTEERIRAAQQAIQFAQASANEETKSSAGDKYETGRAMAQLEIEKNSAQLAEGLKLKQRLLQLDVTRITKTAQAGSLVVTSHGKFFIAVSAGKITLESENYFAVSPSSPIVQNLLGLKSGDQFRFNGKDFLVHSVE
jgi:hypothetical protein